METGPRISNDGDIAPIENIPLVGSGDMQEINYDDAPDWDEVRKILENDSVFAREIKSSIVFKYWNGMNILHWAFFHIAPDDVIELLIARGGKEAASALSDTNLNPLHVACEWNANLRLIQQLIQVGGNEILEQQNDSKMTPFDVTCVYGSAEMTTLLVTKYKQQPNKFSVYYACQGETSYGKLSFLVNELKKLEKSINTKNREYVLLNPYDMGEAQESTQEIAEEHKTTLDLLYQQKGSNVLAVLYMHRVIYEALGTEHISPETFGGLMDWIDEQHAKFYTMIFQDPLVQDLLNDEFIKPQFLAVLMTDLYAQIIVTVVFSYVIKPKSFQGEELENGIVIFLISVASAWLTFREIQQIFTTPVQKFISKWNNYTDILQLVGIFASIVFLRGNNRRADDRLPENIKILMIITSGIVWTQFLIIIGQLNRGIAAFLAAFSKIIVQLVPFMITSIIVLIAFAHMYSVASNLPGEYCASTNYTDVLNNDDDNHLWTCGDLGTLYLTTFTKVLAGDYNMEEQTRIQWVTLGLTVVIGIFLLNILIAEISETYGEVREKARVECWANRFNFIYEVDSSFAFLKSFRTGCGGGYSKKSSTKMKNSRMNFQTLNSGTFTKIQYDFNDDERKFFKWYLGMRVDEKDLRELSLMKRLQIFFNRSVIYDIIAPGRVFEEVLTGPRIEKQTFFYANFQKKIIRVLLYFTVPIVTVGFVFIYLLGFVTWGLAWSPLMKRYLFITPFETNEALFNGKRRRLQLETGKKIDYLYQKFYSDDEAENAPVNLPDLSKKQPDNNSEQPDNIVGKLTTLYQQGIRQTNLPTTTENVQLDKFKWRQRRFG